MTTDKPLGLPKGSIRAILALVLVVAAVALTAFGYTVPGELWGLAGSAVGFYFATRENGDERMYQLQTRR